MGSEALCCSPEREACFCAELCSVAIVLLLLLVLVIFIKTMRVLLLLNCSQILLNVHGSWTWWSLWVPSDSRHSMILYEIVFKCHGVKT